MVEDSTEAAWLDKRAAARMIDATAIAMTPLPASPSVVHAGATSTAGSVSAKTVVALGERRVPLALVAPGDIVKVRSPLRGIRLWRLCLSGLPALKPSFELL